MAINAEEVVEEWLRRKGFFTIRGLKKPGVPQKKIPRVPDMDILALKLDEGMPILCHYEVQFSIKPTGNIGKSKKNAQGEELAIGVRKWVEKKYRDSKKCALRKKLANGDWTFHFVVHKVNNDKELEMIEKSGVSVVKFEDVLNELKNMEDGAFAAYGKDLVDLMLIEPEKEEAEPTDT